MATKWSFLYYYDATIRCYTHPTLQDLIQNTCLKDWKSDELEKILEWVLQDTEAKIWIDCGPFSMMIRESSVNLTDEQIIAFVKDSSEDGINFMPYKDILEDVSVYDEDEEFKEDSGDSEDSEDSGDSEE